MAYPVTRYQIEELVDPVTSYTVTWPAGHQTDDYLVIGVATDTGAASWTTPTGCTVIGTRSTFSTGGQAWYYIKATSGAMANITVTTPSSLGKVYVELIRDADTTTFIDVVATENNSARTTSPTIPAITTTTDGCLIYTTVVTEDPNAIHRASSVKAFSIDYWSTADSTHTFDCTGQVSSGLVASENLTTSSDRSNLLRFAIRNKSGGNTVPAYTGGWDWQVRGGNYDPIGTVAELSTRISTFDSKTVSSFTTTPATSDVSRSLSPESIAYNSTITFNFTTVPSGNIYGAVYPTTSDFSGPFTLTYNAGTLDARIAAGSLFLFLEDSAGNWAGYSAPLIRNATLTFFQRITDFTVVDSSGTIDLTDIVYWGFGFERSGTSTSGRAIELGQWGKLAPFVLIGGDAESGANGRYSANAMSFLDMNNKSFSQGSAQDVITGQIQIGNGTDATHYVAKSTSIEFPASLANYNLQDGDTGLEIYASANCTMDFRQGIIQSTLLSYFTVNASSNTSATYRFGSAIIKGFTVTGKTGVPFDGANFLECGIIDIKAGDQDSLTIDANVSTTHAVLATAGGSFTNSDITKGAEEYAIRLDGTAGNYDVSGTTFTGYATGKKIQVTATTGTWNITTSGNVVLADITSAGATINLVAPNVTVTLSPLITGSEVRAYVGTPTSNTLIDSTESSGTSFVFSHSEAGNAGFIVVRKADYKFIKIDTTYQATNQTIPVQQQADLVYDNP